MQLILAVFLSVNMMACEAETEEVSLEKTNEGKEFVKVDTLPKPKNLEQIYTAIQYPKEAQKNDIQGKVIARILIDTDGTYLKHEILKSDHQLLTKAVEPHLDRLIFTPGYKDGKAVKTWVSLPFNFTFPKE